jgi:hypothetical protein
MSHLYLSTEKTSGREKKREEIEMRCHTEQRGETTHGLSDTVRQTQPTAILRVL